MYINWLVDHTPGVDGRLQDISYLLGATFQILDRLVKDYESLGLMNKDIRYRFINPLVTAIAQGPPVSREELRGSMYDVYAAELEDETGPLRPPVHADTTPQENSETEGQDHHQQGPGLVFPEISTDARVNTEANGTLPQNHIHRPTPVSISRPANGIARTGFDAHRGMEEQLEQEFPTEPPHTAPHQDSEYSGSGYVSDYEPTEVISSGEFNRCWTCSRQANDADARAEAERLHNTEYSDRGVHNPQSNSDISQRDRSHSVESSDSYVEDPGALFLGPEPTDHELHEDLHRYYGTEAVTSNETIDEEDEDMRTLSQEISEVMELVQPEEDEDAWVISENPYEHYQPVDDFTVYHRSDSHDRDRRRGHHQRAHHDTHHRGRAGSNMLSTFVARMEALVQMRQFELENPHASDTQRARVYHSHLPRHARHAASDPFFIPAREVPRDEFARPIEVPRNPSPAQVERGRTESPLLPPLPHEPATVNPWETFRRAWMQERQRLGFR